MKAKPCMMLKEVGKKTGEACERKAPLSVCQGSAMKAKPCMLPKEVGKKTGEACERKAPLSLAEHLGNAAFFAEEIKQLDKLLHNRSNKTGLLQA